MSNGLPGEQDSFSGVSERLVLRNELQPAVACRLVLQETMRSDCDLAGEGHRMESCGGDMPDAYKQCPVSWWGLRANIQAIQAADRHWVYQVCYTFLFGSMTLYLASTVSPSF